MNPNGTEGKVVNADAKLKLYGEDWSVVTCLFADDTVLLAEREEDLQRVVNEFYSVRKRRKLKVDAGKRKGGRKEGCRVCYVNEEGREKGEEEMEGKMKVRTEN